MHFIFVPVPLRMPSSNNSEGWVSPVCSGVLKGGAAQPGAALRAGPESGCTQATGQALSHSGRGTWTKRRRAMRQGWQWGRPGSQFWSCPRRVAIGRCLRVGTSVPPLWTGGSWGTSSVQGTGAVGSGPRQGEVLLLKPRASGTPHSRRRHPQRQSSA